MTVEHRFTSADLDNMPDVEGVRYELIAGELFVSKQPTLEHQYPCTVLLSALHVWSMTVGHGLVYTTPGLVFAEDDDVAPDLVWITKERLARGMDASGHITIGPEITVESLSPGSKNERRDREAKLGLYSRRGVDEYWIVDWRRHAVQVFRRIGPELQIATTLGDADMLTSPLLPGFAVRVASLWQPTVTAE